MPSQSLCKNTICLSRSITSLLDKFSSSYPVKDQSSSSIVFVSFSFSIVCSTSSVIQLCKWPIVCHPASSAFISSSPNYVSNVEHTPRKEDTLVHRIASAFG